MTCGYCHKEFTNPKTHRIENDQVRQKERGIMIAVCFHCGRADVFTQGDTTKWMRDAQQEICDVPIREDRT